MAHEMTATFYGLFGNGYHGHKSILLLTYASRNWRSANTVK